MRCNTHAEVWASETQGGRETERAREKKSERVRVCVSGYSRYGRVRQVVQRMLVRQVGQASCACRLRLHLSMCVYVCLCVRMCMCVCVCVCVCVCIICNRYGCMIVATAVICACVKRVKSVCVKRACKGRGSKHLRKRGGGAGSTNRRAPLECA